MLKAFSLAFLSLAGNFFQPEPPPDIVPYRSLTWQQSSVFELSYRDDPEVQQFIGNYVSGLVSQGKQLEKQGIWVQSEWLELGSHQGTQLLSAASLTKIATTFAALDNWSLEHQFETTIYTTGAVNNGILQGDLIVLGGDDPLFVWEEAIALGNAINQAGIRQVQGDLIVVGNFTMNYAVETLVSAQTLRMGMDQRFWNGEVSRQHSQMTSQPSKPQVAIAGSVQRHPELPLEAKPLLTHKSLVLSDILKLMNIYSNNSIAEAIAQNLGGGEAMGKQVAQKLGIPEAEIQLINGSGLGMDNRMSPRAAVVMFQAVDQAIKGQTAISDLFPVAGRETRGTIKDRKIPKGIVVKTGSLNQVSALAGMVPTSDHGDVWFAIINNGTWDISGYRKQQDQLLQNLANHWQLTPLSSMLIDISNDYFGNPDRIKSTTP